MSGAAIRAAVGLWRSESELETYLAVAVVVAVVAPVLLSHYRKYASTQERNNAITQSPGRIDKGVTEREGSN